MSSPAERVRAQPGRHRQPFIRMLPPIALEKTERPLVYITASFGTVNLNRPRELDYCSALQSQSRGARSKQITTRARQVQSDLFPKPRLERCAAIRKSRDTTFVSKLSDHVRAISRVDDAVIAPRAPAGQMRLDPAEERNRATSRMQWCRSSSITISRMHARGICTTAPARVNASGRR